MTLLCKSVQSGETGPRKREPWEMRQGNVAMVIIIVTRQFARSSLIPGQRQDPGLWIYRYCHNLNRTSNYIKIYKNVNKRKNILYIYIYLYYILKNFLKKKFFFFFF